MWLPEEEFIKKKKKKPEQDGVCRLVKTNKSKRTSFFSMQSY